MKFKDIKNFFTKPFQKASTIHHFRLCKGINRYFVQNTLQRLRYMREDKTYVFAISINSAFGDINQAKILVDAFKQTAYDVKAPLYTFAEDFALESGFYILSAGDRIFANPFSILGDVGCSIKIISLYRLLNQLKITSHSLSSSQSLPYLSGFTERRAEEVAWLNNLIDGVFRDFQDCIYAKRRNIFMRKGLNEHDVKSKLLSGRNFNAVEALEAGLIDEISTFDEFFKKTYKKYKLIEHKIDKQPDSYNITLIKNSLSSVISLVTDPDFDGKLETNALSIENIAERIISNLGDPEFRLRLEDTIREEIEDGIQKLLFCEN